MTTPNSYWPSYDGISNADDRLVTPWYIPGWTSQNRADTADEITPGNGNVLGPGFPTNLAFTRVTGAYFDGNSSGIPGFLTVMMSDGIVVNDGGQYYRMPQRLTGTMNQALPFAYQNWGSGQLFLRLGRLDIQVFATDQTVSGSAIVTDSGCDLTYYVTEHMLGGRTYQISVPSSAAPGPVDINALIVPGTIAPYQYDPVNPMGNMLIQPSLTPPSPAGYDGGNATTDQDWPWEIIDGGSA